MEVINKEHFGTIRKAIENNKFAVFVGSAISYDSKLPSWSKLINSMKTSLENTRTDDYLKIAEHFYLQYGRNTYYSKITEFFPSDSQPNQLHDLILRLKPQHIVTTNWDDLLEKAIESRGDLYFKVASDYELASSPSSQLLIKMHGELAHRNIVFKESDYLAYSDRFPLIENFIKSLFSTHVVLFVGYSISDYNLNQILSWIRNRTQDAPPSFTVLTESNITLSELNYLREKGVYPLLNEEVDIFESEWASLSEKSKRVAKTLKKIADPEISQISDILEEILLDIAHWNIVHPSTFVQLIKDRLNITQVNKIYYDSSNSRIVYNLSHEEQGYSRKEYRKLRRAIIGFMRYVPVIACHLIVKNIFLKIRNPTHFSILDEYTSFDFSLIKQRSTSISINLGSDLDGSFQFAFDNYYLKNLPISREAFMHVASKFFLKSKFIKSVISSYNKKQVCLGEIPWELADKLMEISMEERLSINDNISEMIDKFPKSITGRQKALFQGLDASSSFFLKRYQRFSSIHRKIEHEIRLIARGGISISDTLLEMYNEAHAIILFVIKNKIAVLYSYEYKSIAKIAFEGLLKKMSLNDELKIDETVLYLAVSAYEQKKLMEFLSQIFIEKKALVFSNSNASDYALNVLCNCLTEISSSQRNGKINSYAFTIWSNVTALLCFVKHDEKFSDKLIEHFALAFDTYKWADMSEVINQFVVIQFNKYNNNFSIESLQILFEKQIEKINLQTGLPPQERGALFTNLFNLINERQEDGLDFFRENKDLERFLDNVALMELGEKIRAITGFVFTIYSLSSGEIKNKSNLIIKKAFEDIKSKAFSESYIIFALNMEIIGLLEQQDFDLIMFELNKICERNILKNSTSSSFSVISEQLSRLESSKLKDHEEVVRDVTRLSEAMNKAFENFNK